MQTDVIDLMQVHNLRDSDVHMADNLGAGFGIMPNASMRQRMAEHFENL